MCATRVEGHAETVFALAYDVYRLSATALLGAQGLRASASQGGHVAVEDAVSAQFADRHPGFGKPRFERMRRTRHSAEYPTPEGPPITPDDAAWALDQATAALTFARELISRGELAIFRP